MSQEDMKISITVTIGDKSFECETSQISNGMMPYREADSFLRTYLAQTTGQEEILQVLSRDRSYRMEMVYNPQIGSKLADELADELDYFLSGGYYPEEYYILLSNPSLSSKKLRELMQKHLDRYNQGNKEWFKDSDMLKAIAKNPSADKTILHYLRHCGIPKVAEAAKRKRIT